MHASGPTPVRVRKVDPQAASIVPCSLAAASRSPRERTELPSPRRTSISGTSMQKDEEEPKSTRFIFSLRTMNTRRPAVLINSTKVIGQCAQTGMEDKTTWPKEQQQHNNSFSLFPSTKVWNFRGKKRKQSTQDEDAISVCSFDSSWSVRVALGNAVGSLVQHKKDALILQLLSVRKVAGGRLCFAITFSAPTEPAVTSKTAVPSATMVAKDYPFYLTVKRANCGLEVQTASISARETEEPSNKRVRPLSRVTSLASLIPPVRATPLKRFGQTLQRSISFRNDSRPDLLASRPWTRNVPASTKRRDSKLWSETFDVCVNQMLTSKEIKRQEAIFELSQGEEDLIEDLKLAKKAYHDPMLKLSIMTEQELNQIFGTLDSLIPLHEDLLRLLKEVRKPDGSTECVGHILVSWLPCLNSYDSYCSNQVAAKALLDLKKQDHRVQDFLQRCLESPFSRKLDLWNFLDIPRSRLVKYPLLLKEILRHTPNDHPDQQHLEEAKLHVFLFQEVLVITRAITHNEQLCYQLYRQPIPVKDLVLEDLQDGEVRLGGSIRGAFSNNERIKNFFKVSFKNGSQSQSHSLQANDTFNKQQWLNCIRHAKESVLCASGEGGMLDSEGHFLSTSNRHRVFQQESKLEQMNHSDSGSDCSMDTSEISIDCDHMEQTNSWEKDKELESNV
ncbi:rho guanine nucleotide exchange factor 3 isoform X4 [Hemicordylus capensis]|uniref:rho guanine nucleotide exchange factor 3 isoform X4 n=1 Tax=Hemicordylus capensis TaxID=884348 RepID=UPI002304AAF5|nr:rho guanine nucleotide exchange factor 3 isoform X4 [Hemicordylus capensis]